MARTAKKKTAMTPEEKLAQALVPITEQLYNAPVSWEWVVLSQLVNLYNGDRGVNYPSKKDYVESGIPFINAGAIQDGRLDSSEFNYITQDKFDALRAGKIRKNDILYCLRGSLGKTAIVDFEGDGAISSSLCILRVNDSITVKYLYYLLNSDVIARQQNLAENGSAQPNLSAASVMEYSIPLAPLAEQQRIVERIESLFAKLDEAKEKAQAVVDGAKERKTSLLFQAFTGKLTEQWRAQNEGKYSNDDWLEFEDDVEVQSECPTDLPASWKWIRMGAVGYTNIGLTYRPSDKSDDGIIVLRSSNIQNGKMDYEDIVRVNMSIPDNKMCRKGDLLICARNGSKALVGKTAVVDADGMSYGAFMAIFRSVYNPYIYYFLSSPFFRDLIDKDVGTTTINQVTQAIIKNLPLPFAPKEEQNEVVRILSGLLDKEDTIIETAIRAIDQIEGIKKSILARAFRGDLGTNDPDDESAEELLKRIL